MTTRNLKADRHIRMFFRLVNADWKQLSVKRGLSILHGEMPALNWANQRVEIVTAQLQSDVSSSLVYAMNSVWHFDATGRVNDDLATQETLKALDLPTPDWNKKRFHDLSEADVATLKRLLREDTDE